jgi:protein TonB
MASSQILISPYAGKRPEARPLRNPNRSFRFSGELSDATEKSVFASLLEGLHDVILPPKLAPLKLTSTPIAIQDRMAVKRDPKAVVFAAVINGLVALSVLWLGTRKVVTMVEPASPKLVTLIAPYTPPPLPKAPPKSIVMSGGGGQAMPRPVSHGNPPKLESKPIVLASLAPSTIAPKLTPEPTLNVQADLHMAKVNAPVIGMAAAPAVIVSPGNGAGAGLGAGSGDGLGSGTGGNYGGGIFKVGGGVSQPQVLFAPDPAFTEEARQAKVAGKVVVYLQVNPEGRPMHVKVLRGLGMGLDEKAVEAVRQYKFKPAIKDGHPVTVEMNVDVNFQII